TGGWIDYAGMIEEAGADALELNVYYIPTSAYLMSAEVEYIYTDILRDVKNRVDIPVAMKLSPYFSSPANMALRLYEGGADGLVLFNRFYQPDFDLEALEVVPSLKLSSSDDLRLPLRWIAILYGRIAADLALTGGVHTAQDALKAMMAGAKVAMLASELIAYGADRLSVILADMHAWMVEHEYESIMQMQGSMSQQSVSEPAAFER